MERGCVLNCFLASGPVCVRTTEGCTRDRKCGFGVFCASGACCGRTSRMVATNPVRFLKTVRGTRCLFASSFRNDVFTSVFGIRFVAFGEFGGSIADRGSEIRGLLGVVGVRRELLSRSRIDLVSDLRGVSFRGM